MPSPTLPAAHADAAVKRSFERCWRHFKSELTPDVDGVMRTVVTDEDAGSTPVFWVVPGEPDDSGPIKLQICPGWSGAREVYRGLFEQARMVDATMVLQLSADWWCFHHVFVDFAPHDGDPYTMEAAVIIRTDSHADGVTGEMAWVLEAADTTAAHGVRDRFAIAHDYAAALASEDIDRVLEMMTDDVHGVVRNPLGPEGGAPQAIDDKRQMREAYGSLLDQALIVEVTPIQWSVSDPRYILADLHWTLELRNNGERVQTRTVEIMPLNRDGRLAARLGWGSGLSPA